MWTTIQGRSGLRWAAAAAWMAVIFVLSAQSNLPNLMPGLPGLEEIAGHLSVYALLAALLWWALRGAGIRYPAAWALVAAVLYGAADEFHQSFVPGRTMTVNDLLVDLIGAGLALLIINWIYLRRLRARAG
jgi:UDP-N-acetylmuramyl pentapeptide phosphotransferase/UDP-N-acetylglucosamine-1-phosphate transferase